MSVLAYSGPTATVHVHTFGVKHRGLQLPRFDFTVDCQVLPNPHNRLYHLNGLDPHVQQFMLDAMAYDRRISSWWLSVLDGVPFCEHWAKQHNDRMDIAFYCFGGRHRSVASAEMFAHALRRSNKVNVTVTHHCIKS